jgi:molybdenum cofactor synthesis domain-containing protein
VSTLALAMQHISFIVVAMAEIQHRNAALIVIGDEILSGQIQDGATKYLGTWLDTRGHELRSVEIVPDDRAQLKDAFERAIARYHFVFTTGGLGITHDDITIESIASSLGRKVIFHPEILALLASHYGDELDDARRLMARWFPGFVSTTEFFYFRASLCLCATSSVDLKRGFRFTHR